MEGYDVGTLVTLLRVQIAPALPDTQRLAALEALREAERRPAYCAMLLEVLEDRSLDETTRLVAAISFKNFVARHWKKRARCANEAETAPLHDNAPEKTRLRNGLLRLLDEPSRAIATQLALLISKIVRCDYPQQWPGLQAALVQYLERGSDLQKSRALLALHHILKEMVSMALPSQRRAFHEFAGSMLEGCTNMWRFYTGEYVAWLQDWGQRPDPAAAEAGATRAAWCVLTAKVLQRLVAEGTPSLAASATARSVLEQCLQALAELQIAYLRVSEIRSSSTAHSQVLEGLARVLKRNLKILHSAQRLHTEEFVELPTFRTAVQLTLHALQGLKAPAHRVPLVMPLRLFLEFLTSSLSARDQCPRYAHELDSMLSEHHGAALRSLLFVLILDYLAITPQELQDWDQSPEEYVYESDELEGGGADLFTVRHAVHGTFLALLQQYPEPVCQLLVALHQEVTGQPAMSPEAVLRWDCCYQAVGLACYSLPTYLDFVTSLAPHIVAHLQQPDTPRLLRRRAAWVVGQWAAVLPSPRFPYYALLLDVVRGAPAPPGADVVVRLSALRALFWLVDDLQFEPPAFAPLLPSLMDQLFFFLQHSRCVDVRLSLVSLLTLLMEKMEGLLVQYADPILRTFGGLWALLQACPDADSSETRLKSCLVIALTSLVRCLRHESPVAHPLVVPIIRYATDLNNKDTAFLIEAGLELWGATVQYCPDPVPAPLIDIAVGLPAAVQACEELPTALGILEGYVLLGRGPFVHTFAPYMNPILIQLLLETQPAGQALCLTVADTALMVAPEVAAVALEPMLTEALQYLLTGREGDVLLGPLLCVLLRALVADKGAFRTLAGEHLAAFLDKWIDLHDYLPTDYQRKLSCLAFLCLLPATPEDAVVFERLGALLQGALEGVEMDADPGTPDRGPHNLTDVPAESAEAVRRQRLMELDPVLRLTVKEVMGRKLQDLYAAAGPAAMGVILADPSLLRSLNLHFSGAATEMAEGSDDH